MEEGKISSFQLTRLVMSFMMATGLIFPPLRGVWQDSWLTLLFGLAGGIVFALIYTTLCLRFPGQTLIEIYETVFGPIIGKLFSVAFCGISFISGRRRVRFYYIAHDHCFHDDAKVCLLHHLDHCQRLPL